MKLYIRGTGNISPQHTFGQIGWPFEPTEYSTSRLRAAEPDYSKLIDVKLIRRMSRIIKMGVAAAMNCLQEAGVSNPDAIITGTAYGCLDDTGVFLQKMVQNNEEMLTPTAFIQSTHNTIGAQIALLLKSHSYNNTFVHRGFSFESALLDAMMLLEEGTIQNALVGGVDEITDFSYDIIKRFGTYKKDISSNLELFDQNSRGSIAGEGAAFFLIDKEHSENAYATIDGMSTIYKPSNNAEIRERIEKFVSDCGLALDQIDLVICGRSGDARGDRIYDHLNENVFKNRFVVHYKQLCGEYPTSTAFALWLAVAMVKWGVPQSIFPEVAATSIRKALIYNHSQMIHHSLMLVSAC